MSIIKWASRAWRYIGILRLCRRNKIKLRKWQRRYIRRGGKELIPDERGSGKTTAVVMRALVTNAQGASLDRLLLDDPDYIQHGVAGADWTLHYYDQWRRRFGAMGYKTAPFFARSHLQAAIWQVRQLAPRCPDGINSCVVIRDELSELRSRKRGQDNE